MYIRRHINTECISIGVTIDWNVNLAVELDFIFWIIDFVIIDNFRKYRRRIGPIMHRIGMKSKKEKYVKNT